MRRHTILIGCLLAPLLGGTQPANAQVSPLGFLHAITRPFGAIFGGHHRRMHRHSRGSRSHLRSAHRPRTGHAMAAKPPSREAEPARLGFVGPLAWPSAYEDILGYVFWPHDYDDRLRTHGYGDIVATLFAPSAAYASAERVRTPAGTTGSGATASADRTAPAAACGGGTPTQIDWPMQRISKDLDLNDTQRDALGRLRTAVTEAIATVRAACRDETSLSAPERLRMLEEMLWAVRDASVFIREPLKSFYASLTDEQKSTLTVKAPAAPKPRAGKGESSEEAMRAHFAMAARMCGLPNSGADLDTQFERVIRPTKEQRASLDGFRKRSEQMGQMLLASCPLAIPARPLDRLDAADVWLTNIIFAASSLSLSLNELYGQLTTEQQERFDSLGAS